MGPGVGCAGAIVKAAASYYSVAFFTVASLCCPSTVLLYNNVGSLSFGFCFIFGGYEGKLLESSSLRRLNHSEC